MSRGCGLLLRRSAVHRSLHRLRHFSCQHNTSPELLRGLPLLGATLWRCAQNYAALDEWDEKQLISPTLSAFDRHRLFLVLHTPAQLNFDAAEFVAGAKTALEQLLRATKSHEFAQFVKDKQTTGDDEVVARVRAFCTPRGFSAMEKLIQQALDRQLIIEAEHVEVESLQIHECVYGQVSNAEFALELHAKRRVVNEITDTATLERLYVSIKATVNERVRCERRGELGTILEQKNVYYAVLASNVTTPDVVDWAFVAGVLLTTLRSNEVSQDERSLTKEVKTKS